MRRWGTKRRAKRRCAGAGRPAGIALRCAAAAGAALLGTAVARPASAAEAPGSYAFADGARTVRGAAGSSDAPVIEAGAVYRDAVEADGKLFYRVELDARSNAYVSAVAVPPADGRVTYEDRLKVTLQDRDGRDCGHDDAPIGSAAYPRPLATSAGRTVEAGGSTCQEAGPYYLVVERATGKGSSREPWQLELRPVLEPGPRDAGPTAAPSVWPSASPPPPGGLRDRTGGGGFADAPGLTQGEWKDRIEPGRSRFYRVPVDWGQQLFADAELGSSAGTGGGSVGSALAVDLYNPALGLVTSGNGVSYDGRQKSVALDALPPVAYENRFSSDSTVRAVRFAGWYYLRVTLSPEVGGSFGRKPYGLSLRVTVRGTPKPFAYDGFPGIFAVTAGDREDAAAGRSVPGAAARSATLRTVAVAGIGTGTALVLGLGAWALSARRTAAR
ncbi:hypothetical protein NX801_06015 [Streptomyces sp. LP05-1]|uniref:Peptidase n=1 Tax=Streptomyces pyxinae TaxID=2970734 RepID=A0ABT2CD17_9ACTN|nr:hypothetical protein [Streptomyces sp. LP05-1]MCS0635220.1 hypothetical protein [Streptomyces sp. LP05-1]